MKLKKIMLICILLAILAIGTASAADDTTDKISCEDTVAADFTNQMSSGDEAILEENENTDMGIDVLGAENPETIGGCPDDARENLSIETDGVNNENSSSDDKYAATAEPEMLNAEPAFETKVIFVGEDLFLEYYKSDNIDTSNLPFFDYDEAVTEEYLINGNFSKVDFEINGTTYYAYPADFYDLGGSCTYVWYYVPTKTLPCGNYAAKLKFSNESYRMYNLSVIAYSIGTEENRTDWLYGINDYIILSIRHNVRQLAAVSCHTLSLLRT